MLPVSGSVSRRGKKCGPRIFGQFDQTQGVLVEIVAWMIGEVGREIVAHAYLVVVVQMLDSADGRHCLLVDIDIGLHELWSFIR